MVTGKGGRLRGVQTFWDPAEFGVPACGLEALAGAGPEANAALLLEVFEGGGRTAIADALVLNAGLALWAAGAVRGPHAGMQTAREALRSGAALRTLRRVQELAR